MSHLTFIFGGLAVVMGVLALLFGVMTLIGRAFVARGPAASPAPATAPSPAPLPVAPAGVPPHHLAAIAAAVAEITGGRGRVVRVTAPPHSAHAWAQHGRAELFASHRLRSTWHAPISTSSKGPEAKP